MPTSLNNFATATQIGVTATDLEATNASESKFVGQLTFTNTSAGAVEVIVYKLLTSATETAGSGGNWLIKKSVQPGAVWNAIADVGNIVLGNSQTLSAIAGTTAVINAECAGTVET